MPIEKAICRGPIRTVANILKPQPKTFDLFQNRFRKGNQQGFNPFPLPGAAAAAAPAAFPGAASCGSSELPALDGRDFSELDRTTVPLMRRHMRATLVYTYGYLWGTQKYTWQLYMRTRTPAYIHMPTCADKHRTMQTDLQNPTDTMRVCIRTHRHSGQHKITQINRAHMPCLCMDGCMGGCMGGWLANRWEGGWAGE